MAAYSSPTTNRPPDFSQAGYPAPNAPQSPLRANAGLDAPPPAAVPLPPSGAAPGVPPPHHHHHHHHHHQPHHHVHHHHHHTFGYQPARHQMPPPPPYGTDSGPYAQPPPPEGGNPGGAMGLPPPPPPSYEEHLAREHQGVPRGDTMQQQMPQANSVGAPGAEQPAPMGPPGPIATGSRVGQAFMSPDRVAPQSPSSNAPPPYNARFRHDPYSPEGSRVVSPNRANVSSPNRQAASPNRRDAA